MVDHPVDMKVHLIETKDLEYFEEDCGEHGLVLQLNHFFFHWISSYKEQALNGRNDESIIK